MDGDPLTAVLVDKPAHGTLTLNSNGSFTYTPTANYNGADSFTYRPTTGRRTEHGHGLGHHDNRQRCPGAANDSYSTNEDTALTVAARACWPTTPTRTATR